MSAASVTLGEVLWTPDAERVEQLAITRFTRWVEERTGRTFSRYDDLWRWSVDDVEGFWSLVAEFFGVETGPPGAVVMTRDPMPRTRWFPEARLNYAEHALRREGAADAVMVLSHDGEQTLSRDELRVAVARAAEGLKRVGVRRGDAVASYLTNCPEATVLFLACASIGATYASCTIEFGAPLVIARLEELRPKVLVCAQGYHYRDRWIDRHDAVTQITDALPSIEAVYVVGVGDGLQSAHPSWSDLTRNWAPLVFEAVPFDHPLYVLYSSGTTGKPKAFVHAHGRMLLEHLKLLHLHLDVDEGDRLLHPTTTSWMLWNLGVSTLLLGATSVFYDGDPLHPDPMEIWRIIARSRTTIVNSGAGVIAASMRDGRLPREHADLSALRTVSVTGSPYPPEGFRWLYESVGPDLFVTSGSGGTDLCTGVVGGVPSLPVTAGEMSAAFLGAAVDSYDDAGRSVRGVDGELVLTRPMPSMPVALLGDHDFSRYTASYFAQYPDVWCHGDWIRIRETGQAVITGRSDATLNRAGVRIGTSEIYSVLDPVPGVADCVVVHVPRPSGDLLVLLVVPGDEHLDRPELEAHLRATLRRDLSPRHVPDLVVFVEELPRTLTGKRLEVPIKRILLGEDPADVLDVDAVTGAGAIPQLLLVRASLGRRDPDDSIPS